MITLKSEGNPFGGVTYYVNSYLKGNGDQKYNFPGGFTYYNTKLGKIDSIYIKRVIYSNPATIVEWSDNTKTVSKINDGDTYTKDGGLAICILKKIIGRDATVDTLQSWTSKSEQESIDIGDCEIVTTADVRKKTNSRKKKN